MKVTERHVSTMNALCQNYRSRLLRPFGLDVHEDKQGDHDIMTSMPPAAYRVLDCMVSVLSSKRDKWVQTRAVLTESSLFLSKSSNHKLAVHHIPLHEITEIRKLGEGDSDSDDQGSNKHQAVGLVAGQRDSIGKLRGYRIQNLQIADSGYASDEDSEPDNATPEDFLASRTDILKLKTKKDGSNFGRVFRLRFRGRFLADDGPPRIEVWRQTLETMRALETHAYIRRSYISRKQQQIKAFHEGNRAQHAVAFLIITNFCIEGVSLQFNWDSDSSEAKLLRNIDIAMTAFFLIELLVNMAANLVWAFFSNAWSVFDLIIVVLSLISLGSGALDIVKAARILRVFRVMRAFGRISALRRLINGIASCMAPVMCAMFLCTCVMMMFAIFGVRFFREQSPLYFGTFTRAMYTLFQIATEGTAISREMMEGVEYDVSIYFVVFITVEVFILLPVVVAVLVENFTIAAHRHREDEEKQKLRANMGRKATRNVYMLDPLLEVLMTHRSDEDLTDKLLVLFQKFDVDDDKSLDFQEMFEGLHKLSFTPPIRLTVEHYEYIADSFFPSKGHKTINFRGFSAIMRSQLKFFAQRRLGELIESVQKDSQQEAIKLFAFKMMIHEVDKFVAPDGDGFGGQNWEQGKFFELDAEKKRDIKALIRKERLQKVALRWNNHKMFRAFSTWMDVAGIPLHTEEIGIPVEKESNLLGAVPRRLSQRLSATRCLGSSGSGHGKTWKGRQGRENGGAGGGLSGADRDDKILAALYDMSQRISRLEQQRQDERQVVPSRQTSIDILSQRSSQYEKEGEDEIQQAPTGHQRPAVGRRPQYGNAGEGDERRPASEPRPRSSSRRMAGLEVANADGKIAFEQRRLESSLQQTVPKAQMVSWDPMMAIPPLLYTSMPDPSEKEPVFSGGAPRHGSVTSRSLPSSVGSKKDRMSLQWESLLTDFELPSQDTRAMRHAQGESVRSGKLLGQHSLPNLLQAGWGRAEMHHDAKLEHGSSNPKPRAPNQEVVKFVTSPTRQQSSPPRPSQLASALERPLLLSHSQQLKRHGGRDAETALHPALEYCRRDTFTISRTSSSTKPRKTGTW